MTLSNIQLRTRIGERYTHKRELGVPVRSRGGTASKENDIQSGLAEKYVCDSLGQPFNDQITDGGDGGWDCVYRGYKVDAKWLGMTKVGLPRLNGRILVDIGKLRADIYIAVSGHETRGFQMVGWCTAADLLKHDLFRVPYADDRGRFDRYAMHTSELRPMKDLI